MGQSCGMPMEVASVRLCNELFLFSNTIILKNFATDDTKKTFLWKNMQTGENLSLDSWDRCFATENKINTNGRDVTLPNVQKDRGYVLWPTVGLEEDHFLHNTT